MSPSRHLRPDDLPTVEQFLQKHHEEMTDEDEAEALRRITEFYADTRHLASAKHLFLGLHGRGALVPWIRTVVVTNLVATVLFMLPASKTLNVACVPTIRGIGFEKGTGPIVPAFVPSPFGEVVDYRPTFHETVGRFGIRAFGLLAFTRRRGHCPK
ncbi:MAG: hypothetical protein JNL97_10590 [Verrucomicrobiales bacterium]|nr:hypothetical protein [Verrucomicrobiales bacterium]